MPLSKNEIILLETQIKQAGKNRDAKTLYELMKPPADHSNPREYFRAARGIFLQNRLTLENLLDGYQLAQLIKLDQERNAIIAGKLESHIKSIPFLYAKYKAALFLQNFMTRTPFPTEAKKKFPWLKQTLLDMKLHPSTLAKILSRDGWFKNQYTDMIKKDPELSQILNPPVEPAAAAPLDTSSSTPESVPQATPNIISPFPAVTAEQIQNLENSLMSEVSHASRVVDKMLSAALSEGVTVVTLAEAVAQKVLAEAQNGKMELENSQMSAKAYLKARHISVWLMEHHCGWLVKLFSPLRSKKIELVQAFLSKLTQLTTPPTWDSMTFNEDKNKLDSNLKTAVKELKRIGKTQDSQTQGIDTYSQYEKAFSQRQ